MNIREKLEVFDRLADQAVDELIQTLELGRADIIDRARKRHIAGHVLYGDTLLYEYDLETLSDEERQELADAVVYRVTAIQGGST